MKNKATIICIMDTSGSMGYTKKTLSKKYFHMFKGIIDGRYDEVDCKFIKHTTVAEQVSDINELIENNGSGGTYLSSGSKLALDLIDKEVNPFVSDIYTMIFSDVDNWGEDNDTFIESVRGLCERCVSVQFTEVKISTYTSTILNRLETEIADNNFCTNRIFSKDDIVKVASEMFNTEFKDNSFSEIRNRDNNRVYGNVAKIERTGRTTVVELTDGSRGTAICNATDTYDDELGFKIAKVRAEIKSKEQELIILLG